MKKHKKQHTIRRSVALPRRLVEEVTRAAPEAAKNWNRLVITALEEYAQRRRRSKFEDAMAAMASDPAIRAEVQGIDKEFQKTESDRL